MYQAQYFQSELIDFLFEDDLIIPRDLLVWNLFEFDHYVKTLMYIDELIKYNLKNKNAEFQKNNKFIRSEAICLEEYDIFNSDMIVFDQINRFKTEFLYNYLEGIAYRLMGYKKYDLLITFYDKLIQIMPHKQQNYNYNIGQCLMFSKRYKEAIIYFDRILSIFPADINVYCGIALCLKRLNNFNEAINCYNYLISQYPDASEYYYKKGNCLNKIFLFEQAIKCYDQAICIASEDPKYYHKKGIALKNSQMDKEAIGCFQLALQLSKNIEQDLYNKIKQQIKQVNH